MAVLIFLGSLFSFISSWTAVSGENRDPIARIGVEDGRGFTRIVFPYEHPEEISIEPGPDRRRFVIRMPETEAEIIAPHVAENHHLIRRIEILSDPEKKVRVQVVLTNEFVDWVTYQYEYPPRKVLYLRASEDPRRTIGSRIGLPLAQETKDQKSKALKSPSKTPRTSGSQSHDPLELTKYLRVLRDATNSEKSVGKDPKSSRPARAKSPPQKKKSSKLLKPSKVDRNKVAPKKRRAKKTFHG